MAKEDAAELRAAHAAGALEVRLTLDADLVLDAPGNNVVGYLPGERRRCADRGRRPSRRLVQRRLRQCLGRCGGARSRARARDRRAPPAAYALLHVAHRRGVRPDRQRLRLVHGCVGPDQRDPPGVGGGIALPPQSRGQRPPGAAAADGDAARADAVGAPARAHGRGRGLADERLVHARAPGHRHRGVAVPDLGRSERVRLHLGAVVHAHRLPHAVRHGRDDRLRPSRAALPLLRVPPAERRRRPRGHPRPRGAGARARRPRASARSAWRAAARRPPGGTPPCADGGPSRRSAAVSTDSTRTARRRIRTRRRRATSSVSRRRWRRSAGTIGAPPSGSSRASAATRSRGRSPKRSSPPRANGRERRIPRASWGAKSHPAVSPDLWRELASLRGEAGATAPGPWIERSLKRQLERSRAELARRLAAMTRSLSAAARASR